MALQFLNDGYFTGKVGIGTDNPGDALVVKGGSAGNIDLVSFQNSAGNETHRFYTDSANDGVIETVTNAGVTVNLIQSSGDSYFNGGNVGIGATNPQAKLHVEGGIGIFNVSNDWQQSSLGTNLFRGGNFATTISNETSTLKIFPATTSSRAVGNYWGGINFMHLDPENSTWGTAFTGSQFWIGGRITSLPGQELSALVFATNSSSTAGASPTEKMVILPDGNVGIGTAIPDKTLTIKAGGVLGFKYDATNASFHTITGGGIDPMSFTVNPFSANTSVYSFNGNGGNILTMLNGGNVGIGTASPSFKLQVEGTPLATNGALINIRNSEATATNTSFGGIYFNSSPGNDFSIGKSNINAATTLSFRNGNDGASLMDITPSGNVGIGMTPRTISSYRVLDINGYNGAGGYIGLSSDGVQQGELYSHSGGVDLVTLGAKNTRFYNNGSERMRIASSGDVGIGVTGPSVQLEVGKSVTVGASSVSTSTTNHENVLTVKGKNNYSNGTTWYGDYGQILLSANANMTGSARQFLITNALDNSKFAIIRSVDSSTIPVTNSTGTGVNSGTADFVIDSVGNVGMGTTSPGEKLEITGNSITHGKTRGLGTNYATSEGWVAGGTGSFTSRVGYFGGAFNAIGGGGAENKVEYDIGPFGSRELVWMSVPETVGNDDGGWNKQLNGFNNSANNGFMSVIYVRRDAGSASGNFYHGCSGSNTLNLSGSANTNPYYTATGIGTLPADVWCVAIGIIHATNDATTTNSALGGIYRLDTGQKIQDSTTFRQKTSNTIQEQRVYHYYSTSPTAQLDFTNPGFYILDGSEPSLGELLGSGSADDVFWSANGNDIYNDNSGNVGIGTASPDYKLDVSGASAAAARISTTGFTNLDLVSSRTSGNLGGLRFKQDIDAAQTGEFLGLHGGGFDWKVGDGSVALDIKMRLNSSGKLGIGTTAPTALLHVKEPSGSTSQIKMSAASNEANYGYLTMTDNTVNTAKLTFGTTYGYNTPVDAMTIFNGNVGIGTDSPDATLEVQTGTNAGKVRLSSDGNGAIFSSNGDLQFYTNNVAFSTKFYSANKASTLLTILDSGATTFTSSVSATDGNFNGNVTLTGAGDKILDIYRDGGSGHSIRLHSEGTSWIKNNSNFGIGTDSPKSKLHVDGNVQMENGRMLSFYSGAGANAENIGIKGTDATGTLTFYTEAVERMRITSGGNVNINGTANRPLAITSFDTVSTGAGWDLDATSSNGVITMSTGGSEKMRIEADGTVLIGTASSAYNTTQGYPLHAMSDLTSQSFISVARKGQTSGSAGLIAGLDTANAYLLVRDNIPLILGTNNLSHVFIQPSGYVGIGETNPGAKLDIVGTSSTSSSNLLKIKSTTAFLSAPGHMIDFIRSNNTIRGFVGMNQYGVSYSTTSDYRLKRNIVSIADGINRVKKLKPSRFNWDDGPDDYFVDGFVAHEVGEVIPEAITGEKDAVDKYNAPIYQGIDQSKIVPLLTAALQQAIDKIEQLELRINKLEKQ